MFTIVRVLLGSDFNDCVNVDRGVKRHAVGTNVLIWYTFFSLFCNIVCDC